MLCGVVSCYAVLCCTGWLQAQVDALVSENEALHDQLAKTNTRLAHAAANRATAAATTDADKARLQVSRVMNDVCCCAGLCSVVRHPFSKGNCQQTCQYASPAQNFTY
jgi:predicted component of type VI protein secretion system